MSDESWKAGRWSTALLLAAVFLFGLTPPASAAPEGTMTWGVHITLASRWLDPAETEGIITPFMVLYALHDALVKPMPAGLNTPSLAESFTQSKDGLTYEFVIRKGVKFHNNDPVTAADVKFSFEPVVELVMQAWDGYWRKTPNVKRLVLRSLPEETTRAAALKKGEVDIAYLLTGPVAEDVQRTPGFKLVAPKESQGTFWLDLPDQWDPKSPWHDQRVRQAASYAIDRQALNQAETLGFSKPTGSLIPRALEFSRFFEPDAFDPARAKRLLAEAGYPNGFDAGDLYPWPPYFSMGEALAAYLQNVGIRTRIRTMERAAMTTAWREKKLKNVIVGITGAAGNAATRLDAYVSRNGIYTSGVMPDVEDLFQRQARETDVKKREALVHQVQDILRERVTHIPLYELASIW